MGRKAGVSDFSDLYKVFDRIPIGYNSSFDSGYNQHQVLIMDDVSLKTELADVKTELAEFEKKSLADLKKYKHLRSDYDTLIASYKALETDFEKLQSKNEDLVAQKFGFLDQLDEKEIAMHHMQRDLNNELKDTKAGFKKLCEEHSILNRKNASMA